MWIFTETGFVAIAKFDIEREGAEEFLEQMGGSKIGLREAWLVRARRKADLEQFAGQIGRSLRIVTMDTADYQYRTLMNGLDLMRCMTRAIEEMEYGSLKEAVMQTNPRDEKYYDTLNLVWWDVLKGLDDRGVEGNPLTAPMLTRSPLFDDEEAWND